MDRSSLVAFVAVAIAGVTLAVLARRQQAETMDYLDPPPLSTFVTLPNGHRVRYVDTHTDKTITSNIQTTFVLIHGFTGVLETWSRLVPHLIANTSTTRVIALDLLGSGFSDKPLDIDYTFRNQGKLVTDFVKVLKLHENTGKLVLVGHSSGGIVCAAASPYLPRLDGLFLIAPGFYQVRPTLLSRFPWFGRYMANVLQGKLAGLLEANHVTAGTLTDDTKAAFAAQWQTRHAKQALQEMVIAKEAPYEQVLSDIPATVPLHIVWSKEDAVNPYAADQIQAHFASSSAQPHPPFTYTLLSGSGHYLQHEIPDQLAAEMAKFVETLSS